MNESHGCGWLVETTACRCDDAWFSDPDFTGCECGMDGPRIVECGAPVETVGAGWRCAAGHEHRGLEIESAIGFAADQMERHGMNADDADRYARGAF